MHVPTEAEEERGESLDELLSAEEPEVWEQDESNLFDESGDEVGGVRAGGWSTHARTGSPTPRRIWSPTTSASTAPGASAEEAAMHVIDEYDQR